MRTAVIASVVGTLFILKAAGMLVPAAHGLPRFIDDAYYYLIIARNFAFGGIPSFDGLHATNGFHPLWMLLLAGMYRLIGRDADLFTQIVAAKALEACVLAIALAACIFAFHRLRAKTPLAWGFLGAALIFFVPGFFLWEQGMESTLAAALLLVSFYAMLDDKPRWLAASLPLLFLARLDTLVFVIAPMVVWLRWKENMAWKTFAPLAVVVTLYVSINLALTGHATPISGQIKSSFPMMTPHFYFLWMPLEIAHVTGWDAIYAAPNVFVATLITVILAIACAWAWKATWSRPVALVLAITALLLANILLFQRWDKGVEPRYLALPYLLLGFAAFAAFASRFSARAPGIAFAALAVGCAIGTIERAHADWGRHMDRRTQLEVMAKVAPNERLAGTDVGGFSFWLDRSFVNLDGLVNNRELQDAIRDRRLAAYLERSDVRYLLVAFWDSPQTYAPTDKMYLSRIFPAGVAGPGYDHYDFSLYSYVHDAYSEPIRLYANDEIFREAIGRDGTANAAIVIYRVRRPVTAASGDGKEIRREPSPRAP